MLGLSSLVRLLLMSAIAIAGGVAALPHRAAAREPQNGPPTCTALGPKLLGGNIKYADAQILPANTAPGPMPGNFTGTPPTGTAPVAYCLVVLSYSSTRPNDKTPQNITI